MTSKFTNQELPNKPHQEEPRQRIVSSCEVEENHPKDNMVNESMSFPLNNNVGSILSAAHSQSEFIPVFPESSEHSISFSYRHLPPDQQSNIVKYHTKQTTSNRNGVRSHHRSSPQRITQKRVSQYMSQATNKESGSQELMSNRHSQQQASPRLSQSRFNQIGGLCDGKSILKKLKGLNTRGQKSSNRGRSQTNSQISKNRSNILQSKFLTGDYLSTQRSASGKTTPQVGIEKRSKKQKKYTSRRQLQNQLVQQVYQRKVSKYETDCNQTLPKRHESQSLKMVNETVQMNKTDPTRQVTDNTEALMERLNDQQNLSGNVLTMNDLSYADQPVHKSGSQSHREYGNWTDLNSKQSIQKDQRNSQEVPLTVIDEKTQEHNVDQGLAPRTKSATRKSWNPVD